MFGILVIFVVQSVKPIKCKKNTDSKLDNVNVDVGAFPTQKRFIVNPLTFLMNAAGL